MVRRCKKQDSTASELNTDQLKPNQKPTLLFLLLLIFAACSNDKLTENESAYDDSKYFQGKIIYNYEFESTGMDADSLALLRANRSEMLIRGGDYHFTFFGPDTTIYLYKGEEGRCYFQRLPWTGFRCMDYTVWEDTIVKMEKTNVEEVVLNEKCQQLIMNTAFIKTTYNLSKDLFVDANKFEKHASTNLNQMYREGNGGVALKNRYEFPRFTVTETAVEIEKMKLDTMLFFIPDSLIKVKCR